VLAAESIHTHRGGKHLDTNAARLSLSLLLRKNILQLREKINTNLSAQLVLLCSVSAPDRHTMRRRRRRSAVRGAESSMLEVTGVKHKARGGQIRPYASFYVAPDGLKDMWSPFLKEIEEQFPVLLFWRFQIQWIYVVKLETFSYVQYFYTQINNNQMQRELFNNMLEEFLKCFRPFKRAAMMLMWPTVNMSLTPLL